MKVVLGTGGRFHMFALARELERAGHLECIYSGFPWQSLKRENISRTKVKTFPLVRPIQMVNARSAIQLPESMLRLLHHLSLTTLDFYMHQTSPVCDVFVGHEGVGLWTGARAQGRGSVYVCDRGCSHIGWQADLMKEEYSRVGLKLPRLPSNFNRELEEYDRADLIVVPSRFAKHSFLASGFGSSKVAVVPFGVDIQPVLEPAPLRDGTFTVLFVGHLSVRKGAHDLIESFNRLSHKRKELVIIGTIAKDIRLNLSSQLAQVNVKLVGAATQSQVRAALRRASILVLPSIEDGFGLVLAEAISCGCPILATTNTGAPDLITDGVEGFIVPIRSPLALVEKLQLLADHPDLATAMGASALHRANQLRGWTVYGTSMVEIFRTALAAKRQMLGAYSNA